MENDTLQQVVDTIDYLHSSNAAAHPSEEWHPLSLDSIFAAYQPQELIRHQSLFTGHSLQPEHSEAIAHSVMDAPDWTFGLFVVVVVLFSLYLNSFRVRLKGLFNSTISIREMGYFFRDNNFKRPITILPMMLFYAVTLALSIFYCAHVEGYTLFGSRGLESCLTLFALLVLYFLVKIGLISMLGNIFNNDNATKLYNANNYIYQFVSCFLLLPVLLFAFYSNGNANNLVTLLLSVISFFFVIRLFRGMKLILTNATSSKFYLFYYLCILEIVPLLILGKQFITL